MALKALRDAGLRLVVVSNSDGTAEETLIRQGLRPYFHAVLDSHHVGYEKPDPHIFERAIEFAGAAPERTLHVSDLYDVDVIGARQAGLHALLIDPFEDWPAVGCELAPDLWTLSCRIVIGGE
jgi:HAD superfamily hydrolase (TIGR01509 family)